MGQLYIVADISSYIHSAICSIVVAAISIDSYLLIFPCLNVYSNTYPKEVECHFSFPLIDYLLREEDPSFRNSSNFPSTPKCWFAS